MLSNAIILSASRWRRASGVADPPFAWIANGATAAITQIHAVNVLIARISNKAFSVIGLLILCRARTVWKANTWCTARIALIAPIVLVVWD